MQIRRLVAADRAGWAALWHDYLVFYGSQVSDEVYDTTFARLTGNDAQEFNALVAEREGALVGLAHFLSHRHCWRVENVCYLQDLFVDPSLRGQGVGRALINAVYAAADAAGAPGVYWLTQVGNAPARVLYDSIGQVTDFIKYQRV